jgi:hypothetical protein
MAGKIEMADHLESILTGLGMEGQRECSTQIGGIRGKGESGVGGQRRVSTPCRHPLRAHPQ